MRKIIKYVVVGLVVLVAVLGVVVFALHQMGRSRLAGAPSVTVRTVSVTSDAASIARGQHLAAISSCTFCHGAGLGGAVFIDQPPIGYLPAPNLTAGKGGVGKQYTDKDWGRAIRHGVAKDGRTIVVMPSEHYSGYSDDDLAALIAYLKSLPPVDNDTGPRNIAFPGTIIFGVLAYGKRPVSTINHEGVGDGGAPVIEASPAYGDYLVSIAACRGCHGVALDGKLERRAPAGPDLTAEGPLANWTRDDFAAAIRTGLTPDKRVLSEEMPWRSYTQMTDTEVDALWAYVRSLEALD